MTDHASKTVTFGELLKQYESQKGYGVSEHFKKRKFIEIEVTKEK